MKNLSLQKSMSGFKAVSLSLLLSLGIISCSDNEGIVLDTFTESNSLKSSKSVKLTYSGLTASTEQSENPIENIHDGTLDTRWSGEGSSVNVDFDFGQEVMVDYINIAFHNGDERTSTFSYWESNDGNSWEKKGKKNSSGDSEEFEEFDLNNITARYFRIEFQGNTKNKWNSVSELEVYGTPGEDVVAEEDPETDECNATAATGTSSEPTTDSVVLSWDKIANIDHYNVRYRATNSSTWLYEYFLTTNTVTIEGLSSGTNYEWQTRSKCADGSASDYDEVTMTFTTEKGDDDDVTTPTGSLDPSKTPAENFDLSQWKITVSSGDDYSVSELNDNFEHSNQFYTAADGGMVFKNYPKGAGTTTNSTYSRVELREMLRGTNDDIDTKGINKNNWVFSSSSSSNQEKAGGVGGKLTATLAVNKVTTTSSSDNQLGRIVIGQIHASDHEPIRLYYKKMPGETNGGIYFMHEDKDSNETAINIIGNLAKETGGGAGDYTGDEAPSNGIPLGEVFSYKIEVIGTMLYVDIYRASGSLSASYDMSDSGYANDWMYFKAGLYSQNKTVQDSSDYEQVTFYALENSHD